MPKPFLLKNSSGSSQPIAGGIKWGHTFPNGISPKVNVIVRLEVEHASYDVADQNISHYTMECNLPAPQNISMCYGHLRHQRKLF